MHKITSLRASKNTNSVFSATKQIMKCEATDAQKLLSQWKKLLNAILRGKAQVHENVFFLMKWTFFAMQKTDFMSLSFFAEKVILGA